MPWKTPEGPPQVYPRAPLPLNLYFGLRARYVSCDCPYCCTSATIVAHSSPACLQVWLPLSSVLRCDLDRLLKRLTFFYSSLSTAGTPLPSSRSQNSEEFSDTCTVFSFITRRHAYFMFNCHSLPLTSRKELLSFFILKG